MDERGQQRPVRGGLVRSESTTVRFPRDWFFATPAARHRGPIWWHRVSAGAPAPQAHGEVACSLLPRWSCLDM